MKKTAWIILLILTACLLLASCSEDTPLTSTEGVHQTTDPTKPTVTTAPPRDTVGVTGIVLSDGDLTLYVGTSYRLSATVLPSNATDRVLSFSSSDDSIVTVSRDGTLNALKKGEATITATASNGVSDRITVTVIDDRDEASYFRSEFSASLPNPEIEFSHSSGGTCRLEDGKLILSTDGYDFANGKIYFDKSIDGYLIAKATVAVETNAFSNLFYFYTSEDTTGNIVCSIAAENGNFKYHNGSSWVDLQPCRLGIFYEIEVLLRIGDRSRYGDKGCFDIRIDDKTYTGLPFRKGGDGVEDSIRTFFFGSNKPGAEMIYENLSLEKAEKPFLFLTENKKTLSFDSESSFTPTYELLGFPKPEVTVTCDKADGYTLENGKLTFSRAGQYRFTVTAKNQYGEDSETLTVTVTSPNTPPEITVTESEKTLLLTDNTVYTLSYTAFLGSPEATKTITCNQKDGFSLTGDTVTFTKEGDYVFTVTLANGIGRSEATVTVHIVKERVAFEETFDAMPDGTKVTKTGSGNLTFETGTLHVNTASGACGAFADIPLGTKLSEAYTASVDFTVNTGAFSNILFMLADGTSPASNGGICIAVENGTLKYHNGSVWMGITAVELGKQHNVTTVFDWQSGKQEIFLDGVSLGTFAVRNANNAKNTTHLYLGSDKSNTDFTIDSIKITYHTAS